MNDIGELRQALEDLIEVVRLQTSEVQKLAAHVESQTVRLPHPNQFPLVLSELTGLRHRVQQMAESGVSE